MRWLHVSLRFEYFDQQRTKNKEQSTKIGMTESEAQSYVCPEGFSGLTDGNMVDRFATAWSMAANESDTDDSCACVACNLHIYLAYKQRNSGIIC